jgi:VanZ family protein
MDHVLRKSGHFIGYAVLSGLTFLALRNTHRDRIPTSLRRPWGKALSDLWQVEWSLIAILLTVVTASMDEIHQTFLPSRTGRWQDVVLDTSGAFALQLVIYLACQLLVSTRGGTTFPPAPKLPLAESE